MRLWFTFLLLIPVVFSGFGQDTSKSNTISIDEIDKKIVDDKKLQSPVYEQNTNSSITRFPDIYYEYRIEILDKKSPIKLDYNQDVRKYIDLYLDKRTDKVSEFLGLKDLYFPIFEEYLDKYNLPLELKYLPIIESGLDPRAQSSSGAMGLWQLLLNSSKLLGLKVDSYVDERCDPYRSTDAACRYLKYLYSLFNDWQLALAAYNGGPGEVRNAIARSGGKTKFWEIQEYLPEQTKWYVPAYIAIVYLTNYAGEHGIKAKAPLLSYYQTDTLHLNEQTEFSKITEKTGISDETLNFLNPVYRRGIIPNDEKPQTLVLPSDKVLSFLRLENQIYSRTNDTANYHDIVSAAGNTDGLTKTTYTVKKGDFLHRIAMNYGCTIDNLRAWNKLKSDNLEQGQKLEVWINSGKTTEKQENKTDKDKVFYYTVRKGDTVWSIAERFKCDSIKSIMQANNIKNAQDLRPGQKIKIIVGN